MQASGFLPEQEGAWPQGCVLDDFCLSQVRLEDINSFSSRPLIPFINFLTDYFFYLIHLFSQPFIHTPLVYYSLVHLFAHPFISY